MKTSNFYVKGNAGKGGLIADFFNLLDCSNTQDVREYESPYNVFFVDEDRIIIMANRLVSEDIKLFDFIREYFEEVTTEEMLAYVTRKQ